MTIAVDLERQATKQTNKSLIVAIFPTYLDIIVLLNCFGTRLVCESAKTESPHKMTNIK